MMGKSHSLSGVVVGLAVAPVLGLDTLAGAIPFAAVTAGYALFPDLDCEGATASRLLGPFTAVLSFLMRMLSKVLFKLTATKNRSSPGTHRHATHTSLFAAGLGVTAALTSTGAPWVTLGWVVFGVLAAAAASGKWVLAVAAVAVALPMVTDGTAGMGVLTGMSGWIGLAVGLGCLCHLAGDGVTRSGIPLLWPIPIHGDTWYQVHFLPEPARLHTGKTPETWVYWCLAAAAFAALLAVPQVWAHVGPNLLAVTT